jgi:transcription initiation factor IIE alpha subunit
MNNDNIESVEIVESTIVVEISPQTDELVETEMAGESDEVKRETKSLIEALRRRAQSEAESAGKLTRETYLNAVRKARAAIEGEKIMERDRLEYYWAVFQEETERNWHLMMKEFVDFSTRLQNAVKAGWEAFNAPRHQR